MKFCEKCGKEIMDDAAICPSCGCAVKGEKKAVATATAPAVVEVPKMAKTASILGVLSLLLLAPLGIPAIILAIKSKKLTNGVLCKQAKTGLIFGILGLCFWGVSLFMLLGGM